LAVLVTKTTSSLPSEATLSGSCTSSCENAPDAASPTSTNLCSGFFSTEDALRISSFLAITPLDFASDVITSFVFLSEGFETLFSGFLSALVDAADGFADIVLVDPSFFLDVALLESVLEVLVDGVFDFGLLESFLTLEVVDFVDFVAPEEEDFVDADFALSVLSFVDFVDRLVRGVSEDFVDVAPVEFVELVVFLVDAARDGALDDGLLADEVEVVTLELCGALVLLGR
jgi:hypothetical protein